MLCKRRRSTRCTLVLELTRRKMQFVQDSVEEMKEFYTMVNYFVYDLDGFEQEVVVISSFTVSVCA